MDLDKEILLTFQTDSTVSKMYDRMRDLDADQVKVTEVFQSLKRLQLITSTNDHKTRRESFCITRKGREYLKITYGISLPDINRRAYGKVSTAVTNGA